MGVLDKVKASAGEATTRARESAATAQTNRRLRQAYRELGETTFELVTSGEVAHPSLNPVTERIRSLQAELEQPQT